MAEHLFVDTTFFVARFNRRDRNHRAAAAFLESLEQPGAPAYRLVTNDFIFDELVTTLLFRSGRHALTAAAGNAVRDSKAIQMLHVDKPAIGEAWTMFLERADKMWSFTDCVSFVQMDKLAIRTALTFDRNFREAGYAALP